MQESDVKREYDLLLDAYLRAKEHRKAIGCSIPDKYLRDGNTARLSVWLISSKGTQLIKAERKALKAEAKCLRELQKFAQWHYATNNGHK